MTARYCIVNFQRWHYAWLQALCPAADANVQEVSTESLRDIERSNSWTILYDGDPVACGAVLMQWPGRHTAWTYLGSVSAKHMLCVTRLARQLLDSVAGRIEFTVVRDFQAGHRWAAMLGFSVETPLLRAYGPRGEDHVGYVRFN